MTNGFFGRQAATIAKAANRKEAVSWWEQLGKNLTDPKLWNTVLNVVAKPSRPPTTGPIAVPPFPPSNDKGTENKSTEIGKLENLLAQKIQEVCSWLSAVV